MGQVSFNLMKTLRNLESSLQYSDTPAATLATAPAAIRRMHIVAQYGTLVVTAATLAGVLLQSSIATISGLRKR